MATVRCPACNRALNLPERGAVESAQCPVCRHVFEVPSRAAPPSAPTFREAPPDTPRAAAAAPDVGHKGNDSAANWLRAAGVAGLFQLLCCSCIPLAIQASNDVALLVYAGCFVFQAIASLTAFGCARPLRLGRSRGWVRAAGVLSLLMAVLSVAMCLPVFAEMAEHTGRHRLTAENDVLVFFVAQLVHVVVIVCFLVAGVKTLRAVAARSFRD